VAISKIEAVRADFLNVIANDDEDKIPEKVEQALLKQFEHDLKKLADHIVRVEAIKATLTQ